METRDSQKKFGGVIQHKARMKGNFEDLINKIRKGSAVLLESNDKKKNFEDSYIVTITPFGEERKSSKKIVISLEFATGQVTASYTLSIGYLNGLELFDADAYLPDLVFRFPEFKDENETFLLNYSKRYLQEDFEPFLM